MKHFLLIILFLLFLKISFSQYMYVKSIFASDNVYSLTDLRTIKFNVNADTMMINKIDKSVDARSLNMIRKITFFNLVGINSSTLNTSTENFQLTIFPNPACDHVVIECNLASNSDVELSIYNMTGMLVYYFKNEQLLAGKYTYSWNLTDISNKRVENGIYICQMKAANKIQTSKLIIL